MALLDFLKNKKEAEKAKKSVKKTAKVSAPKAPEKKDVKAEKPETPAKAVAPKVKEGNFSHAAVKQPHISEKATFLAEQNQYVFDVLPNFNKNEIKKSVEGIYGVNVLSVNFVKIPAKKRRVGRTEGFRKGYKKAIVKIANGQKIEIL